MCGNLNLCKYIIDNELRKLLKKLNKIKLNQYFYKFI
jgi:3-methyladenine DNA glycosylase AlkC